MKAKFNNAQVDNLAKYFADLSKILVGSSVIGFFIPINSVKVDLPSFIGGLIWAIVLLIASIDLVKNKQFETLS